MTSFELVDNTLPLICDPHVHFFPASREHPYSVADLQADQSSGPRITATVYIEAANSFRTEGRPALRPVGETEWVVQQDPAGVISGIVGYVDLRLGDAVEEVVEAHCTAGRGRFRGVRFRTNWDDHPEIPNSRFADAPGLLTHASVHQGAAALARLGMTLDVFVYFLQLNEVLELALAHPDLPIVVNHFGAPLGIGPYAGKRDETLVALRRGLQPLAQTGNVYLKLGGLGWPGHGLGWELRAEPPSATEVANAWAPLHAWCIDTFGPERCMCESNYPVDRVSLPYRTIWDAHLAMTHGLTERERSAVLHDTAARFYRLDR
jgi:L-fuconolactonase